MATKPRGGALMAGPLRKEFYFIYLDCLWQGYFTFTNHFFHGGGVIPLPPDVFFHVGGGIPLPSWKWTRFYSAHIPEHRSRKIDPIGNFHWYSKHRLDTRVESLVRILTSQILTVWRFELNYKLVYFLMNDKKKAIPNATIYFITNFYELLMEPKRFS